MTARLALATLLLLSTNALAQLPSARLAAVYPPGTKAGGTIEVALTGQDLDGATELRFSHPGLTAKPAGDASRTGAKFTVTIAADVPVGVYDCRAVGRFGISNPRAFAVSDRDDATANLVRRDGGAAALPLNVAVSGRLAAAATDVYEIQAAKGQRVLVDCQAREIDSKLMPSLTVSDAAGRELDRSRRSGYLDFTAPEAGVYAVRVSDLQYRGGPEFFYRLSAHTGPRIDHVFPPAGRPGTRQSFTLFGRNLPGGKPAGVSAADGKPLESLVVDVDVPADPAPHQRLDAAGLTGLVAATLDGFAYRLKSAYGLSNAVPILFAATDATPEAETLGEKGGVNDAPDRAQKLTLPAEVAGRLYPRGDRDWYAVEAKKGDVYYIEVVSERLGQPTSPGVVVQRSTVEKVGVEKVTDVLESPEDETTLGTPSFKLATRDAILKWDVKEDGTYRIGLRDRFGTSADNPSAVYRLSIRKPAPDFRVLAVPASGVAGNGGGNQGTAADTAVWNPTLRRGGVAPMRVLVLRRDGFAGDVTVAATDLPAGVKAEPVTLSGTDAFALLTLSAADDAKPVATAVRVVGTAKVGDENVSRPAAGGVVVQGVGGDGKPVNNNQLTDPIVSRLTSQLAVGVCDEVEPLTIVPAEQKVFEVTAGTKFPIAMKLRKTAELKSSGGMKGGGGNNNNAPRIKAYGVEGLRGRDLTLDVESDGFTYELDLAQNKLAPGTYTFCLTTAAQVRYDRPGTTPAAEDPKMKAAGGGGKKPEPNQAATVVYSAPITIKVVAAPKPEKKK